MQQVNNSSEVSAPVAPK